MADNMTAKPRGAERPLKYNPTGAYDRIPDDFKQDAEAGVGEEQVLVPCSSCGRKFREDRLEKHTSACKALADGASRRGAFNTTTSSTLSSPMRSTGGLSTSSLMKSTGSTKSTASTTASPSVAKKR
eukprot:GILI01003831.1.p1 GENE.GILI01003831.1~~GILI01003831.1.p1  ORF type:complete len:127 (+),score=35.04 GILI01003831.1:103-483(+)